MKAEQQSVTLTEQEYTPVNRLAKAKGLSFSAALRMIINEWNEQIGSQRIRITGAGQQALDETRESSTAE